MKRIVGIGVFMGTEEKRIQHIKLTPKKEEEKQETNYDDIMGV